MSLVQRPCQWTIRLAIFSFHTRSMSRSIQACLLDPLHSPHRTSKRLWRIRPKTERPWLRIFCRVGENSSNARHTFWMMISHDGQKSKGDSETLISLTPLKTTLGPKRTQYRFQPQLQLFTKTYIRISLSLGPPHLLARLSRFFYDCGIALTCLILPNYLPAVWLGAAVSAGLSFW